MKQLIKWLYRKIFPNLYFYLIREFNGCDSLLDLGCGNDSIVKHAKKIYKVGVDVFKPYIEESKQKHIHNEYICHDIRTLKINRKFDIALAIDALEHLSKADGLKLIKKMEYYARKKIIIFTPNGWLHQSIHDKNPWQIHRSGWDADELKNLGFRVYGVHGIKWLRKEKAAIRFRPKYLWLLISDITQKVTYHFPNLAFHLLAIKDINE